MGVQTRYCDVRYIPTRDVGKYILGSTAVVGDVIWPKWVESAPFWTMVVVWTLQQEQVRH